MKLALFPSLAACLLAAPTLAQSTLIRIHGSVSQVAGVPSAANLGVFADAQAGEPLTLDIRVTQTLIDTLPNGTKLYDLDAIGSRLTIGTKTDALAPALFSSLQIYDSMAGDLLASPITLSSASDGLVVLVDFAVQQISGQPSLFDSDDPTLLQGQAVDLTGVPGFFAIYAFGGGATVHLTSDSVEFLPESNVGISYCSAVPNSTGAPGTLEAFGSAGIAQDDVVLWAAGLPEDTMAFFLGSRTQGYVVGAGGSAGNLCLGGAIGRYIAGGSVVDTGSQGAAALPLNLSALALPTGNVAAQVGETWNFQLWHRDVVAGQATSNFTEALSLTFE